MLLFVIGLISGIAISCIFFAIVPTNGTLNVDQRDPKKDVWRLDISGDLDRIPNKKRIRLKIHKIGPQK